MKIRNHTFTSPPSGGSGGGLAKPPTYIAMCSGVECASLAALVRGWRPLCFSETDPFPASVLKYRYPDVPNPGDTTRVDWGRYRGKCDLVVAGPPCQAFSAAGKRKSLADPRNNPTLAFAAAVDAIDPKYIVWENVPGVLSLRDNAFGCLLARLAGIGRPLEPGPRPGRGRSSLHWAWDRKAAAHRPKWADAGSVAGPGRSLAWRILDARFFGVPRRRRRVFVVAGRAGDRPDPAEMLLVFEGLCGDSAAGGEAREKAAAAVARLAGAAGAGKTARRKRQTA
ncbi:MAG: DNA cytosine methyltransferase [Planctomycetota bacterium]|jgi:DNA (cytosine-5)-methyltransferase 1|nr:DNA cytosine methyltransferase [Planctomycetota bacterium]